MPFQEGAQFCLSNLAQITGAGPLWENVFFTVDFTVLFSPPQCGGESQ